MNDAGLESELEELIRSFELGDWPIASIAFAAFERRLARHFTLEEELLFPDFSREFPREANELIDEHRAIRKRIEALGIGVDVHQTRLGAIRELAALLRRHVARENELLFRWADNRQVLVFEDKVSHSPTRTRTEPS